MPWFRMYTEIKDDPKLQRLDFSARWLWVVVLCIAAGSPARGRLLIAAGVPYTLSEIAREADLPEPDAREYLEQMASMRMVGWNGDTLCVLNWDKRQFQSDTSTDRVKRHRRRQNGPVDAAGDETFQERFRNAPEADTEADTDAYTDLNDKQAKSPPPITPETVVSLWNEICGDALPRVQALTGKRRTQIKARVAAAGDRDEVWWRSYFARIRGSPFCTGDNDRGWRASVDFAIRSEDSVAKVLEGSYDRGRGTGSGRASTGGGHGEYEGIVESDDDLPAV